MDAETLRRFISEVRAGRTPCPEDLEAVAASLSDILSGADPKDALGIKRRRGRPSVAPTIGGHLERYQAVIEVRQLQSDGMKYEDAIETIAARFSKSAETVRTWCKKRPLREMADESLRNKKRVEDTLREAEALGIHCNNNWPISKVRAAIQQAKAKG